MRIATLLLATALALLPGVSAAQEAATPTDPVALFNSVCMGDQVHLKRKDFEGLHYAQLPKGVREALGFAVPPDGVTRFSGQLALSDAEVPNEFLVLLPARKVFLLLPDPRKSGSVAPVCGVIWQGNHYLEAIKAADPLRPVGGLQSVPGVPRLAIEGGIKGLNLTVIKSLGVIFGAAEYRGWTVLRVAPDPSPEETQP